MFSMAQRKMTSITFEGKNSRHFEEKGCLLRRNLECTEREQQWCRRYIGRASTFARQIRRMAVQCHLQTSLIFIQSFARVQ